MGKKKSILAIMLTLVLAMSMVPTTSISAAKKVKLNKTKLTIYVGKTVTLKLRNSKNKVKWSSSNKKVAIVTKKGRVKGKKVGKAIIIAKVGKKKYRCKVIIKKEIIPQPTSKKNEQSTIIKQEETTKNREQSTTRRQEETTKNQEQPTTDKQEETTTNGDDYGDSGENWKISYTSSVGEHKRCLIREYVGKERNVVIPSKIRGANVIGIESYAFNKCDVIDNLVIPVGTSTLTVTGIYTS